MHDADAGESARVDNGKAVIDRHRGKQAAVEARHRTAHTETSGQRSPEPVAAGGQRRDGRLIGDFTELVTAARIRHGELVTEVTWARDRLGDLRLEVTPASPAACVDAARGTSAKRHRQTNGDARSAGMAEAPVPAGVEGKPVDLRRIAERRDPCALARVGRALDSIVGRRQRAKPPQRQPGIQAQHCAGDRVAAGSRHVAEIPGCERCRGPEAQAPGRVLNACHPLSSGAGRAETHAGRSTGESDISEIPGCANTARRNARRGLAATLHSHVIGEPPAIRAAHRHLAVAVAAQSKVAPDQTRLDGIGLQAGY